jgi:hypothetical protein
MPIAAPPAIHAVARTKRGIAPVRHAAAPSTAHTIAATIATFSTYSG